eukprot:10309869-Karenia_brevis.AAC.1
MDGSWNLSHRCFSIERANARRGNEVFEHSFGQPQRGHRNLREGNALIAGGAIHFFRGGQRQRVAPWLDEMGGLRSGSVRRHCSMSDCR